MVQRDYWVNRVSVLECTATTEFILVPYLSIAPARFFTLDYSAYDFDLSFLLQSSLLALTLRLEVLNHQIP